MIKLSRQLLSLLFFLTVVVAAQAQYTETKEFQKRFAVEPETAIEISNKYGKVELVTWDKDSVLFDIRMKVEERKMNRLDRTLNNIDFDFTSSSHYLIARTIVDKNKSQLEAEFQRFKETLLQADGTIEIDYKVWVPASNSLKVENKFGDIYIDDYNGPITIGLSNGKLKAHDLTNQATIKLNFADASINSMKKGVFLRITAISTSKRLTIYGYPVNPLKSKLSSLNRSPLIPDEISSGYANPSRLKPMPASLPSD